MSRAEIALAVIGALCIAIAYFGVRSAARDCGKDFWP
jgi:hypothetical protein